MPRREVGFAPAVPGELTDGLARIREQFHVPEDFPAEVVAAARAAAGSPRLPSADHTDLAFETIDPAGSRDLDQALFLQRDGSGFVVWYAIADVAAFVTAGDPIDREAHRRGATRYAPDRRTPLHPPELSEQAASLLADEIRPAFVWRIRLDDAGELTDATVTRALVRSRAQHDYREVQQAIQAGTATESIMLLAEIGPLREQRERDRGGISLNVPEQVIDTSGADWALQYRAPLPVEGWNAQLSLLTGMAAATIMLDGRIGILRTLPPADRGSLRALRHTARLLKIDWPDRLGYPDFVRSLDPANPAHAAMLTACTRLFRGAGYRAFTDTVPDPKDAEHAAIASPYAHCTAPLRRLADRYALEVCASLVAGDPVPDWVTAALGRLPEEMADAGRGASAYEHAIIDLMEAHLLRPRVGEEFAGVITQVADDGRSGRLVVADPAVEATVTGQDLPLGEQVTARLAQADPAQRTVRFELT